MNIAFTVNKLFVLVAVLIWLIVGIIDVGGLGTINHEVGWVAIGLGVFGISFLL